MGAWIGTIIGALVAGIIIGPLALGFLISTAARRLFARRRHSVLLIAALVPGLAQADAVIDWNTPAWRSSGASVVSQVSFVPSPQVPRNV